MTVLPFDPAGLLDLSPRRAVQVAAEHAAAVDPGRETDGYDEPLPDTDFHFAAGRPLGRRLDAAHNTAVWSRS